MTPYWSAEDVTLHLGDCLAVMAGMAGASVDAVVTDPPYGLEFMGAEWDKFGRDTGNGYREKPRMTADHMGKGFKELPNHLEAGRPYQQWCEAWAAECLHVLKPGGFLLAFGGTRTWHRLVCAIEDAGFEIRDSMSWLYGSGFPKSLDVAKAIDKAAGAERVIIAEGAAVRRMIPGADQNLTGSWIKDNGREFVPTVTAPATEAAAEWEGYGTALKPAWEPIAVARRPLAGTVVQNVLEHGTGALNIDGCRVEAAGRPHRVSHAEDTPGKTTYGSNGPGGGSHADGLTDAGRWPPNVLLGPEAAAELDRQSGVLTSGANPERRSSDKFRDAYGKFAGQAGCTPHRGTDSGGASRFFPVFRYEAKADAKERPRLKDGTAHPTVKPVDLMAWLVRLVTRPGALILDPFAGSGTTGQACLAEGRRCVLIEQHEPYCELIKVRLTKPIQPGLFDLEAS